MSSTTLTVHFPHGEHITLVAYKPRHKSRLNMEATVELPAELIDNRQVWHPLHGQLNSYPAEMNFGTGGATKDIFIKWARTNNQLDKLRKELHVYHKRLRKLQDVLIPTCFGMFTRTDINGSTIGCLVLQRLQERLPTSHDGSVWNGRIIAALREIHRAGVIHGSVEHPDSFFTDGGQVKVVGFSKAFSHECPGRDCFELRDLEQLYYVPEHRET